MVTNFRELSVWTLGMEMIEAIYRVSQGFPREEQRGLTSQMRRAAVSIPSNIAEGFNRRYRKEFARYLGISFGSCAELETQIEICHRLGFMPDSTRQTLLKQLTTEQKMLNTLMQKIRTFSEPETQKKEPGTRN